MKSRPLTLPPPTRSPFAENRAGSRTGIVDQVHLRPKTKWLRPRPSRRSLVEFARSLAVMSGARLAILDALKAVGEQTTDKRMKLVVESVILDVSKGKALSTAIRGHSGIFDPLFQQLVQIGESTGRLDVMLEQTAAYLEKANWLRRKVLTALTYPAVVLTAAVASVTFLVVFIVPTFADMFADFGADLPAATQFVMEMSDFVARYGLMVVLVSAGLFLGLRRTMRIRAARRRAHTLIFYAPLLGSLMRQVAVARFCRTLGTLVSNGVRLVEALHVLSETTQNIVVSEMIEEMIETVTRGRRLASALPQRGIFPPMVVQMITIGEEAGRLSEILMHTAAHYEKEVDAHVDALASVIEPVLILILGLIVGGILISMYLPLFSLMDVVR